MLHENSEKVLTQDEFESIQATEDIFDTTLSYGDLLRSPNTPRRRDWREKNGGQCNISPPSTAQVQLIPAAAAALPRRPHACAVASGPAQGWSGEL